MEQARDMESVERVLLSHAEMCYAVAFALTHSPDRAQELARYALTRAWHLRESAGSSKEIKRTLLAALRKRFLEDCSHARRVLKRHALIAERR